MRDIDGQAGRQVTVDGTWRPVAYRLSQRDVVHLVVNLVQSLGGLTN